MLEYLLMVVATLLQCPRTPEAEMKQQVHSPQLWWWYRDSPLPPGGVYFSAMLLLCTTTWCIKFREPEPNVCGGEFVRYLLAQHPEVEAKVLAELDAADLLVTPQRPNPRPLEYNDLHKLTYLNAVIKVTKEERVHRPFQSACAWLKTAQRFPTGKHRVPVVKLAPPYAVDPDRVPSLEKKAQCAGNVRVL